MERVIFCYFIPRAGMRFCERSVGVIVIKGEVSKEMSKSAIEKGSLKVGYYPLTKYPISNIYNLFRYNVQWVPKSAGKFSTTY